MVPFLVTLLLVDRTFKLELELLDEDTLAVMVVGVIDEFVVVCSDTSFLCGEGDRSLGGIMLLVLGIGTESGAINV